MASTDPQNEKLQKEHDQAVQDISKILDKSRPKNLPQGLTAGVSSIVSGAVGAAGVAVLAPTVGLVQGAKSGGILGGVIGVTGGAVVGVVGAVGMAVGGERVSRVYPTYCETTILTNCIGQRCCFRYHSDCSWGHCDSTSDDCSPSWQMVE